jgi:hypothetical protein
MSVTTTADEKLRLAKEKIKEARDLLIECVDDNTWGSEHWTDQYRETIHKSIHALAIIKINLK